MNNLSAKANLDTAKNNQALHQSNTTKDKLFSIIAHDLRSPMASLSGTLDILSINVLTRQELEMVKKELQRQFSYTDTTLQKLLQWAKSQMQSKTVTPTPITLTNIVNDKINLFEKVAREKQINLINHVSVRYKCLSTKITCEPFSET